MLILLVVNNNNNMKIFLITYDLVGSETYVDYMKLHNKIRILFNTWARPVRSVWIIKSDLNISTIRDQIAPSLDYDDRLLVVEMTGLTAWKNLSEEVASWMIKNMKNL